jgi:hypothetical protein
LITNFLLESFKGRREKFVPPGFELILAGESRAAGSADQVKDTRLFG